MTLHSSATTTDGTPFYVLGGTLRYDAPSYVERQADHQLGECLQRGEFCYVLTSRQMGKSSLMTRAAFRLRQRGVAVAVLDLTSIGLNLSAEQWYAGLLGKLGQDLDLEDELEAHWLAHPQLSPLARWMAALREVVLAHGDAQVVIFVDEVDAVRSLPFSADEFFAAIRGCYNRRAEDTRYQRLTFCLLGVATPSDLISDIRTTPFNLGQRIVLNDFTEAEAAPLARGLCADAQVGHQLLRRVLHWTGGHPYLTQRLCQAVATDEQARQPADVDRLCRELFLSHRAREFDDNLHFVSERMLRSVTDLAALLDLYARVLRGERIPDDESDALAAVLRLSGITRVTHGLLTPRNRIYQQVFNSAWISEHMPGAELRRQRMAFNRGVLRTSLIALVILVIVAILLWHTQQLARIAKNNARIATHYALEAKKFAIQAAEKQQEAEQNAQITTNNEQEAVRNAHIADTEAKLAKKSSSELQKDLDKYVIHVKYFSSYVKKYRDVECILPLTLPQVQHRQLSLKGSFQNGRLIAMEAVDGMGRLTINHSIGAFIGNTTYRSYAMRECRWVFSRDSEGHVVRETAYDRQGRIVYEFLYTTPDSAVYLDKSGYPSVREGSGAAYVRFQWNAQGLLAENRYTDRDGNPQPDRYGTYGTRYKYDARGLPTQETNLDVDGKPVVSKQGMAYAEWSYDNYGNMTRIALFDLHYHLTTEIEDGWAIRCCKYDKYGNIKEERLYGPNLQPVSYSDSHIFKTVMRYNTQGQLVMDEYYGIDEKPVRNKDGCAKIAYYFDSQGRVNKERFYGPNGRPTLDGAWTAGFTLRYDQSSNVINVEYFDIDGNVALCQNRFAGLERLYDGQGNLTKESCLGIDGKLTCCKDGYASKRYFYNARGQQVGWVAYGLHGETAIDKSEGAAIKHVAYDDRGNVTEDNYFGVGGKPSTTLEYATLTIHYDTNGNDIEEICHGPDGKCRNRSEGYAICHMLYDRNGNEISRRYCTKDDKNTINSKLGYSIRTQHYDERGNVDELAYYDINDKPILLSEGYAQEKIRCNEWRHTIDEQYFDTKRHLVKTTDGYAHNTAEYDRYGRLTKATALGTDDKPCLTAIKISSIVYESGPNNEWTKKTYWDTHGKKTLNVEGCYKEIDRYNDRSQICDVSYYGLDNKLIVGKSGFARKTIGYNEKGLAVEESYYGSNDKQMIIANGYARVRCQYNAHGFDIRDSYYGVTDRPILCKEGYARQDKSYDNDGTVTGYRYFDAKGVPLTRIIAIAEVFDGQGKQIGLQKGDVILSYNGQAVTPSEIKKYLDALSIPGSGKRELKIRRAGKVITYHVAPGKLGVRLIDAMADSVKTNSQ